MTPIDAYLEQVDPNQKTVLLKLRNLIRQMVPDAEESISYGVPTFKYQKRPLIYMAAFKDHMSLYPASDAMIESIGPDVASFRTSKGTLQFTVNRQIPDSILKRIITFRLQSLTSNAA
jgi:uncharacterized protein YdhG (YjbR/CyaY superfamily)